MFIVDMIRTIAPQSVRASISALASFERYLAGVYRFGEAPRKYDIFDWNAIQLESYARWLTQNGQTQGSYLAFIRSFYRWGLRSGFAGFSRREMSKFQVVTLKGTLRGHIARFRDPIKGALFWEEQKQIRFAIKSGAGQKHDRAIVMLFDETGMRAEAAVRLKVEHLAPTPAGDAYILRIPKVKQRSWASATYERVISQQLGELLLTLATGRERDEFLIFWLTTRKPGRELNDAVARWARETGLMTARLSDDSSLRPLPLTTSRFRRTKATTLAENGASPEIIAEWLDDRSIAMAAIYAANSSVIVDVLAATLDRHPAWYRVIRLFLGRIESHNDIKGPEILGGAPHLTCDSLHLRVGVIGNCAAPIPCHMLPEKRYPPLNCYQCEHFRAKRDETVHRMQLDQVKFEINSNIGIESDRIATIFRADMVAILQVIAAIREEIGATSYRTDAGTIVGAVIAKAYVD